jgi:hypothetical protein
MAEATVRKQALTRVANVCGDDTARLVGILSRADYVWESVVSADVDDEQVRDWCNVTLADACLTARIVAVLGTRTDTVNMDAMRDDPRLVDEPVPGPFIVRDDLTDEIIEAAAADPRNRRR